MLVFQVENLEVQLKEANIRLDEAESNKEKMEKELKAAIDKIWTLRDIISDLEGRVVISGEHREQLERKLAEMDDVVEELKRANQEMASEVSFSYFAFSGTSL